ncbi:hypothetical protein DFH29DRAFT_883162 [Suillus ampliporus]|nr:hypothetical protein DFH29DRAFT_883162 [Suillus ampliporus]
MFMRYTHLGIGHPVALRRIIRDCLGSRAPADSDAMAIVDGAGHEEVSDGEGQEECSDSDEQEFSEEEFSEEELEDESEEDCDGEDGRGDEDTLDPDDPLSF